MLEKVPFSTSDIEELRAQPKTLKLTFVFLLIIYTPLSFLVGLLGLLKKGYGYWPTTLAFLFFFTVITLFSLLRDYILYKKDIKTKLKLSGDLIVKSKSEKRKTWIVLFDSAQVKRLSLLSKSAFEKLNEGDVINIEISKYSKYIFSLKKGAESLL